MSRAIDTLFQVSRGPSLWLKSLATPLGAAVMVIWALASGWPGPIVATDLEQSRLDVALPPPQRKGQIRQTFVAQHDGLTEIELMWAIGGESDRDSRLIIEVMDEGGNQLVERHLRSAGLVHNQRYTVGFPRQGDSAGRQYTILIGGTVGNQISAWGYSLDVIDEGELSTGSTPSPARDLRFVSRYELGLGQAMGRLITMLVEGGEIIVVAASLIFMPGALALVLAGGRGAPRDPLAWWSIALALGLSLWPLSWLWLSVVGGRWRTWSLGAILMAGWLATVAIWLRRRRGQRRRLTWPALNREHLALLLVLIVSLAVRLLAARDLAFPPWVDASRHALITVIMGEKGQMLSNYRPLLPVDQAAYHFGFHTLSAGTALLSDGELPRVLLIMGQLFNALTPLAIYGGAYLIGRRRGAALLAAFLVALPFFFPGYYATWSRLTQLTAILILPPALGVTWRLIRGAKRGGQGWPLLAVMVAGLFLVHFRVFALYLPFAGLTWAASRGRGGRSLAYAGLLTAALVLPSALQLAAAARELNLGGPIAGYNDFPTGYVQTGWEQEFWCMGAAAFLLATVAGFRARAWAYPLLLLSGWMGLVAVLLSGRRLGLPETSVLNLNSAYITAFAPLALILALAASRLWRWLGRRPGVFAAPVCVAAGAALAAATLFGVRQQVTIINSQTILAQPQDEGALAWIEGSTPSSARIAVNSWRWLSSTWAGQDGGAWIVPLTGRESTTPPADYHYDRDLVEQVASFNETAMDTEEWSAPEAARWLQEQGVTHVFVGARGGFFDPAALSDNPGLTLRYGHDGAFVFSVNAGSALPVSPVGD